MAKAKEEEKKVIKKTGEKAVKPKKESTETDDVKREQAEPKAEAKTAKAGKRSAKSIKESEEKQAKEAKKAAKTEAEAEQVVRVTHKPPKSRLERRGRKYRELSKLIDKTKSYTIEQAAELAVKTSPSKFDATVELHVRLGVDPKQADQNVRGMVSLPAGTGKTLKIAVFADATQTEAAKKAGAFIAAGDEFLQQLDKGELNFDILISTPANMPKLGRYAKLLGPKGLMPNPKSGTVVNDVAKAVKEASGGRVEYRVDSNGIVHVPVGKVSFGKEKILQNAQAVISSLKNSKPSSVKGAYMISSYITTSMGPSIQLDTAG